MQRGHALRDRGGGNIPQEPEERKTVTLRSRREPRPPVPAKTKLLFAGAWALGLFAAGYLLLLLPGLFGKSVFDAGENAPRAFLVLLPFVNALGGIYLGVEAAKSGWKSLRTAICLLLALELGITLLMALVT